MSIAGVSLSVPVHPLLAPIGVLCYGHDAVLLYTRQRLLGLLGCSTEAAANAAEYRAALHKECPSVVVICQTVTGEERADALQFAKEQCPKSRFLVMINKFESEPAGQEYILLNTYGGPKSFTRAVFNLL